MNTTNKYSICFLPDQRTIERIAQMKLDLAQHIGWFNSKNAIGHITIAEFHALESQIEPLIQSLTRTSQHFDPLTIELNEFKSFTNGAFYLEVDPLSHVILQDYSKQITQVLPFKKIIKSNSPHLSIARKLTASKLQQAFDYFDPPHIRMACDQIVLRKLNTERLQFDIIANFPFLSMQKVQEKQLSLF